MDQTDFGVNKQHFFWSKSLTSWRSNGQQQTAKFSPLASVAKSTLLQRIDSRMSGGSASGWYVRTCKTKASKWKNVKLIVRKLVQGRNAKLCRKGSIVSTSPQIIKVLNKLQWMSANLVMTTCLRWIMTNALSRAVSGGARNQSLCFLIQIYKTFLN